MGLIRTITVLLGLSKLRVRDKEESDHWIRVQVEYRAGEVPCRWCGERTGRVHSRKLQLKGDRRVWKKPVYLELQEAALSLSPRRRGHLTGACRGEHVCETVWYEAPESCSHNSRAGVNSRLAHCDRRATGPDTRAGSMPGRCADPTARPVTACGRRRCGERACAPARW